MKNRIHITFCFLLVGLHLAGQQQTLFTNFLLHPYQYNPAYAGTVPGTQFNIAHRNQWVGFDGAPKESTFSGWGNFRKHANMTAGGMIISNRSGLIQRTSFQGSYAYQLKINKSMTMSFGLAFGGVQYNVKVYDAKPYDQDDIFLNSEILRAFAFDANAGIHLYSKKFFFGLSNQQMLNSKILWANTIGRLAPHYYVYTGYNFNLDSTGTWQLQPSLLARFSGPAPSQFDYSLKLLYKGMVWTGATIRHRFENVKAGGNYSEITSACLLFGCTLKKALNIGYSYDFTTTHLNNYSSGSHEVFVSYLFPYRHKKSAAEMVKDADETELNTIDNSIKTNLKNKKKQEKEPKKKEEPEKNKKPIPETKEPEVKPETPKEENNIEETEGDKPDRNKKLNQETIPEHVKDKSI
jgi:type IX secretion system PorP/SprF family membrane protein